MESKSQTPLPPPPTPPPLATGTNDSVNRGDDGGTPGDKQFQLDLNRPCRITDIKFDGVKRTRPTLLAKMVADIFPSKSLLEMLQKSIQVQENLRSLNAFSQIEMQVEPIDEAKKDEYRLTFAVKERGRLTASAETAVDNYATHLNLELSTPNVNGIGDSFRLVSKFTKHFYSGECRYTVPITPWRLLWNPIYSIFYSQYQFDNNPSGFDQEDKSIINQVDFLSLPNVQHSISFENVWRRIKSSSSLTPIEIREQSGHSIKSSIKHTVTWDNRAGGNFPSQGLLTKLSNEITTNLVSGSARFTRHEAQLQFNTLIYPQYDILLQLNVLAGALVRPNKINICDKFFAGGPLTLRGFKFQGLAPSVRGHPLGDMSYLSAGLHLYSILPYTTPETPINDFIRPHLFVNTGTIGDVTDVRRLSSKDDVKSELVRFRNSLRYSCGFGLVMYFMRIRLEVNYCLPLIFKEGDLNMHGLQWGFGLTYS